MKRFFGKHLTTRINILLNGDKTSYGKSRSGISLVEWFLEIQGVKVKVIKIHQAS